MRPWRAWWPGSSAWCSISRRETDSGQRIVHAAHPDLVLDHVPVHAAVVEADVPGGASLAELGGPEKGRGGVRERCLIDRRDAVVPVPAEEAARLVADGGE